MLAVWVITVAPLTVAWIVKSPGVEDEKLPVATPFTSVGPLGELTGALTVVSASVTFAPCMGFPFASFTVTVIMLDTPEPTGESAVTVLVPTRAEAFVNCTTRFAKAKCTSTSRSGPPPGIGRDRAFSIARYCWILP